MEGGNPTRTQDVALDLPDLGRDGASADTAIVDHDASLDGSTCRKETAADGIGRDTAADGGGPLPCTGRFMLGGFPPVEKTGATPSSAALGPSRNRGRTVVGRVG